MTATEAKRSIYRKCRHCKWWGCGVWENGEPIEKWGICMAHGHNDKDGEEDACRSFDYAKWAVAKAVMDAKEGGAK